MKTHWTEFLPLAALPPLTGRSCHGFAETSRKGRRPQKQHKFKKETVNFRFFLFELLKHGWPPGANAFAFCVVRLLPYPYTPTEAHSLPLQPFRHPPSLSKTEFFDKLAEKACRLFFTDGRPFRLRNNLYSNIRLTVRTRPERRGRWEAKRGR